MERFIEFQDAVTFDELAEAVAVNNSGILILRFSKLTGTVKIRTSGEVSKRELKRAFLPHKVKKIHQDFPLRRQEMTL